MLIKNAADIASSEITPQSTYLRRREFIGALVSRLMVRRIEAEDDGGLPGYLFRTIDRIQVIAGAVVIAKKRPPAVAPLWESVIPRSKSGIETPMPSDPPRRWSSWSARLSADALEYALL